MQQLVGNIIIQQWLGYHHAAMSRGYHHAAMGTGFHHAAMGRDTIRLQWGTEVYICPPV